MTLTLQPYDKGLCFVGPNNTALHVSPDIFSRTDRSSILSDGTSTIYTPEHVLAACFICGITGLRIVMTHHEVPIMDGSAEPFIDALMSVDHRPTSQSKPAPVTINHPMVIHQDEAEIMVIPDNQFRLTYSLSYPDTFVGSQIVTVCADDRDALKTAIGPARTYGFLAEYNDLLAHGLAKGGSTDVAVVIGEDDYLTPLRFNDELCRHKILDMIGDLSVLGRPIQGHVIGIKSGHALNRLLVKALSESLCQCSLALRQSVGPKER